MFYNCKNLEEINFEGINTSSLENMDFSFSLCSKIISIDLSKFDTSKVTSMHATFYNCDSLEKINFGNINTSSVVNMRSLFNRCFKLSSLNLSNFDTSNVKIFDYMFSRCSSLKYLDISTFNSLNLLSMEYMFRNCSSLIYLNMDSFQLNSTINKTDAFKEVSPNLVFCIKDNYTKNYLFGEDKISICLESCSNENNKKINILIEGCVKSCINNRFEYEYNNVCYHECPNDTYSLFYDDENYIYNSKECLEQMPQGYYLDINEKNIKSVMKIVNLVMEKEMKHIIIVLNVRKITLLLFVYLCQ
jgi:surface protein